MKQQQIHEFNFEMINHCICVMDEIMNNKMLPGRKVQALILSLYNL